nr:hypothetical protein [uncultured Carboxylicivirga sp.]
MLVRAITEGDQVSSFYKSNEIIACAWEKYASENNASIEGMVNSYIVEAKFSFVREKYTIAIDTIKQATNGSGVPSLFKNIPVINITNIELSALRLTGSEWSIKKKSKVRDLCLSVFKSCYPFERDNKYTVIGPKEMNQHPFIDGKTWKDLNALGTLEELEYANQTLKMMYLSQIDPYRADALIKRLTKKFGSLN